MGDHDLSSFPLRGPMNGAGAGMNFRRILSMGDYEEDAILRENILYSFNPIGSFQ